MRRTILILLALSFTVLLATSAVGLEVTEQFPIFTSHMVVTDDPVVVVFDQSLDIASVTDDSFFVTLLGNITHIAGSISFATTNLTDDTVILTPDTAWDWAVRHQLNITGDVQSAGGDPFSGTLPFDGMFVANIPNDFNIPIFNPQDPFAMFVDTTVLMGYNPIEPEAEVEPWEIPGVNVTGAWKYTKGSPTVIIAVVDDGIRNYETAEIRRTFFINAGELPLPNENGVACTEYDCNGDGRFDVDDYALDDRVTPAGDITARDLIDTFSNDIDEDGNGLVDDISGWDFMRQTNEALGVQDFPEGTHGDGEIRLITTQANNGIGGLPGICPDCMALPIRASSGLVYDYNIVSAGVRYAASMGASVINFAGVNFTWSENGHQAFLDAYDNGAISVAASGDEMTYHHWMPAAGEDVISVKTIFPMVPVELADFLNLSIFGFTETYCTNYSTHTHVSVPAKTGCTSDSTGNTSGMLGLIYSYAHEQGYDLTADEAKQLLTMTADDVASNCATIVNLLGVCQEGFDEHFAYGRPDVENALLALGDPDLGIEPTIPPTARIIYPKWWQTFDPGQTVNLEVVADISSRVTPYSWELQIAPGNEPKEKDFQTVASGTETGPVSGVIGTVPLADIFSEAWASGTPRNQYTFEATVRLQAFYQSAGKGEVMGESRKSISVHSDNDPETGLVPGFPIDIGASGESSPLLYDLDGDLDNRLEIIFGTADAQVVALKYDDDLGSWDYIDGFPIDLSGDDPWVSDSIFASLAVGDIFGDGTPEIVATTMQGKVYAIDFDTGDLLDGFPVSADVPDNSSALAFAYGNGFVASPLLVDLDRDGILEIVAASVDQKVYAWKPSQAGGKAEVMPGWPVLCRSESGLVPPQKVCQGQDIPSAIVGTPAAGILDPFSDDEHISQYPSVVVATAEACDGLVLPDTRVYAVFHDGMDHPGGPFLPGWPVKPLAPLGDALPLPILVGSPSSPVIAVTDNGTRVGVGSMGWFPQLVYYEEGRTTVEQIPIIVGFNAVGSSSFSSLFNDGNLQYISPLLGVIKIDELGFNLFNSRIHAMDLEKPHDLVLEGQVEDLPMLVTQSVADLDNDGNREVIAGSGGYLVHAFSHTGKEAAGWPKYTQKWILAAPAVGDMDADGKIEVIAHTREGVLYAWESAGESCPNGEPNSDWRRFHHDERNSGYYGLDTIPPSRIVDLTAELLDNGEIRLTFAAPGDDWLCGTAAAYNIRYSTDDGADLSDPEQFALATQISESPEPQLGGGNEIITLSASDAKHFAIQARDEVGNLSRISIDATVVPATDDDTDDDATDDDVIDDDVADDDEVDDDVVTDDDDDDDNDDGCGC